MKPSLPRFLAPLISRPRSNTPRLRLANGRWTPIVLPPSSLPPIPISLAGDSGLVSLAEVLKLDEGIKGKGKEKAGSVRGFEVPMKPSAPKDDECCMSGCAHCVYDVHLEELQHYHSTIATQRARLLASVTQEGAEPLCEEEWPSEFGSWEANVARAGTQSEGERIAGAKEVAEKEAKALRASLPIAQRAFLEFEETLRKRRKARELAALRGEMGKGTRRVG